MSNLVTSYTYFFKVRARNAHDYGDFSEILGILVAQEPVQPEAPVTELVATNVVVTWVEPPNAGQPILGYRVYLKKADGTFNLDFTYCDGENLIVMAQLRCEIPSITFVSPLYGLNWGDKIYAKIIAHNSYGDSPESPLSNPTVLMTNPDQPINLVENTNLRTFNELALVWTDGPSNNGSPISDYLISIAIGIDSTEFSVLEDMVITKSYIAKGLQVGEYYKFKIQSRNNYGHSTYSNELLLICAYVPDAPSLPIVDLITDHVKISWPEPFDGGALINGYRIEIRNAENVYI